MSASELKELIRQYDVRPTRSLGQNFLVDERIIDKIIDGAFITKEDTVIEVGPGMGSITIPLARRAKSVIAVEIDKHLLPVLNARLSGFDNVKVVNADILELDAGKLIKEVLSAQQDQHTRVKVVANLPYYITTPIIMKLLEEDPGISMMVFMVQKEVAMRMAAKPGGKDYGSLSVAVQYYCKPETIVTVSPHCFVPQPDVDSTIVRMAVYEQPSVTAKDRSAFFKIVKAAFGQRRKTLVNALSNSGYFNCSKEEILETLKSIGLDENKRGEALTIMQFAQLTNAFLDSNSLKI